PKNLAIRHQTPTLIGCILLKILNQPGNSRRPSSFAPLRSAKPSIMTQFLETRQALWFFDAAESMVRSTLAANRRASHSIPIFRQIASASKTLRALAVAGTRIP
ncbi:hypothetical protein, partial [Ramlibacter sp.]|uniref:hypothetical protein n=1 Tax=Ramlibacter sp. TaxID=1917967 RepID=UPI0035AF6BCE